MTSQSTPTLAECFERYFELMEAYAVGPHQVGPSGEHSVITEGIVIGMAKEACSNEC